MGFLQQLGNVFTGDESARAARKAGDILQQQAISSAGDVGAAGESAIGRFDPLANVGGRGIDLAGFLGSPQQKFDFAQQNPLFNLGVQNLTENVQQSAAGRQRLSAGDTLERLRTVPLEVAQPLIQGQKQDILNLLNIAQGTTGAQAGIETQTARDVADLLTGGASARAGGVVGAQSARTGATGNIFDLGTTIAGLPSGTFSNPFAATPPPQTFNQAPVIPGF